MADLLRIVDGISATPTVLLDLQDEVSFAAVFNPGMPELRRGTTSSALVDGDIETFSAYSDRVLSIDLELITTTQAESATKLQTLVRLLNRDTGWLMWQPVGVEHPVFFQMRRSSPETIQDVVAATAYRLPTLRVPAAPFAYGLPESGEVTIRNNPITGTNRMCAVLDPAKGDVPSPLVVSFVTPTDPPGPATIARFRSVVSSTPVPMGTAAAVRVGAVVAGGAHGSTTVTSTADATMATGTRVRVDPSVVGESTSFALGITDLQPGAYNVYLRARANGHSFSAWLRSGDESQAKTLRRGNPNAVGVEWFDLGTYWLPKNSLDGGDPFGLLPDHPGGPGTLVLRFLENTTQFIDLDCVIFVPAGTDSRTATQSTFGVPGAYYFDPTTLKLDGVNDERYVEFPESGLTRTQHVGSIAGSLPVVRPDGPTALTLLPVVAFDSATYSEISGGVRDEIPDPLNADVVVTWKYFPRYIYLRGAE